MIRFTREGLFDTQFHVELLRRIAAYQYQGIQVSDLLPPFIRDMLTSFAPQGVSALFPADPAQDIRERSLEALRLFTYKSMVLVSYILYSSVRI